jgi:hypothetical protein
MPFNTAPPPPDTFVPRPDEVNQLLSSFLNFTEPRTVATVTTMEGGGGFGKTTLAQHICYLPEMEAAFPDGILWLAIGQSPQLIDLINNQIRLFESEAIHTDLNTAAAHLRNLLTGKRVLLVLDDVWDEQYATLFRPRSPTCSMLITTRQQGLNVQRNTQSINVNEMTTDQGANLLVSRLSSPPTDLTPFRELAAHLGKWPLLLNLAAAQFYELVQLDGLPVAEALAELWNALDEDGFTAFERADEEQRNRAIGISLELSLERLGTDQRRRFVELTVFPQDIDIPFAAIMRLWGDLSPRKVRDLLRYMHRFSLFTNYDGRGQTLRLHDVIHYYLLTQQNDLPGLHARLLNAYRSLLPGTGVSWTDLPEDEPYIWDHLAYHLIEAGLTQQLWATVKDLSYLAKKSLVSSPTAMEADLQRAADKFPDDGQLQQLTRYVTNTAHLLPRCPNVSDRQATLQSRLVP